MADNRRLSRDRFLFHNNSPTRCFHKGQDDIEVVMEDQALDVGRGVAEGLAQASEEEEGVRLSDIQSSIRSRQDT